MPKKFYNVYNSYDADPLKTISECEDLAVKYFSDLNTGAVSSNQAVQKNQDNTNDSESEQESEAQTQQPVDPSTGPQNQNESWNFILNEDYLNAVGTTAAAGFSAGWNISKIGGLIGSGLSGLLTGLLPLGAGAYSLGYAAGGHGAEHGKWIVDDRELQQQLSEFTEHPKSLQTYIGSAIDSYVKDLMSLYEQGLRHITTNSKSTEISKLNKMVINLCVSRTP